MSHIITAPETLTTTEVWQQVEKVLKGAAVAMHFDGCHKIYVSLGLTEAEQMKKLGYKTERPNIETLQKWWSQSCDLKFIDAIKSSGEETEFIPLINQEF